MIEGGSNSAPGLSNEGFEVQSMSRYVPTSSDFSVIARKLIDTRVMYTQQHTRAPHTIHSSRRYAYFLAVIDR